MTQQSWYYDAILYMYALSLLFMFADFAQRNPQAKRMGTGLLAFVWVLQTGFLFAAARLLHIEDWFLMFSTLLFFSWLLVTISLLFILVLRIDVLFIVNLAGFVAAAFAFVRDQSLPGLMQEWKVQDDLLLIHISLAVVGYAAFCLSALFSAMLLFAYRMLKSKQLNIRLLRLPSLDDLHTWSFRFTVIGTPLLLLSLLLGVASVAAGQAWFLLLDYKVVNSLIILLIYSVYLWRRYRGRSSWTGLAVTNLIGFAAVVINYTLTNQLSSFH